MLETNIEAAHETGVERFFYASTACVYAAHKQSQPDNPGLKESDAYPAMPEDGYGWQKLFTERMCRHFREDFGLEGTPLRLHFKKRRKLGEDPGDGAHRQRMLIQILTLLICRRSLGKHRCTGHGHRQRAECPHSKN